jgi:hypothetical protein
MQVARWQCLTRTLALLAEVHRTGALPNVPFLGRSAKTFHASMCCNRSAQRVVSFTDRM